MIWFTADQHFMHEGIIQSCNRPYRNSTIMDKDLMKRHNAVVKPDDTIYMVGDLSNKTAMYTGALANILKRLNGTKHLILGNHDVLPPFSYVNDLGFTSVHTSLTVEEFILHHDPCASIIKQKSVWLCGHVHTLFEECSNVINVGVDVRNYTPMNIFTVRQLAAARGGMLWVP